MPRYQRESKSFSSENLNGLFTNKRIYITLIKHSSPLSLFVNGVQICKKDTDTTADDIYNFTQEINTEELQFAFTKVLSHNNDVKDLLANYCGEYLMKWISFKDIDFVGKCDSEITISYILDTQSKKKKKVANTQPPVEEDPDVKNVKWCQDQVDMANKIYHEVQDSFKNEDFMKLPEEARLKYYQSKYANFNRQHPLCIRYMISMFGYSAKAFTKYIKKVSTSKPGDADEFLQRQADYVTLLWREKTTHWTQAGSKKVREDAYRIVHEESESFKQLQDIAEEVADKINSKFSNEHKLELKRVMEKMKGQDIKDCIYKSIREQEMERKIAETAESSDEEETTIDLSNGSF